MRTGCAARSRSSARSGCRRRAVDRAELARAARCRRATVVRLDPGLAFGTGSHASTRLVLEFLENSARAGSRVLDYGCGSGILAIVAAQARRRARSPPWTSIRRRSKRRLRMRAHNGVALQRARAGCSSPWNLRPDRRQHPRRPSHRAGAAARGAHARGRAASRSREFSKRRPPSVIAAYARRLRHRGRRHRRGLGAAGRAAAMILTTRRQGTRR